MKRAVIAFVALMSVVAPRFLHGQDRGVVVSDPRRVLVIAAHPDDEDTQLITWLQRGGRAETAYLSLTRGDGGQNLIGNELGEQLGVIRTEELLAARRIDGAHQFFTRAYDFGFSKTAAETYAHWPKDSLLNDVVKVVRSWRPQVIVAVFSGTPKDGHGQHQVSGILAKEAYESAGDTVRFPVSKFGPAWTPLKFYRFAGFNLAEPTISINVGEYNRALGKSYAEIAAESRSQHKSQGFGSIQRKGTVWDRLKRESTRVNESTPATSEKSIFDGLPDVPVRASTSADSDAIRDVSLEAVTDRRYLALGDSALVKATVYNRSVKPITMLRVNEPNATPTESGQTRVLIAPDSSYQWSFYVHGRSITQPWWLVTPRNGDLFSPAVPILKNPADWFMTPEDEREKRDWIIAPVTTDQTGTFTTLRTPAVYRFADPVKGDIQRPLAVAPALSVTLDRAVELASANTPIDRFFNVKLRSAVMSKQPVTVKLNLPSALSADSASRTVLLDSAGSRTVTFRVHGKLPAGTHALSATGTMDGKTYSNGYIPIEYDHITPERIYRPATVSIDAIDVKVPAKLKLAYIPGVGDNVEPTLVQLGIPVTIVQPGEIPTVDFSKYTTVVVGPRAYQASRELIDNNPYLLTFARNGGTLVVQYGQYEMQTPGVMPYAITLTRPADRITEEVAPLTILDAKSPAFNYPNKITQADFNGWVQERSLYMPRTFDSHYRALIAGNDPGEPSNSGGILVTPYGRGLYVYTTLSFFRQLPAGNSGGTRLFVNLLSMKAPGR